MTWLAISALCLLQCSQWAILPPACAVVHEAHQAASEAGKDESRRVEYAVKFLRGLMRANEFTVVKDAAKATISYLRSKDGARLGSEVFLTAVVTFDDETLAVGFFFSQTHPSVVKFDVRVGSKVVTVDVPESVANDWAKDSEHTVVFRHRALVDRSDLGLDAVAIENELIAIRAVFPDESSTPWSYAMGPSNHTVREE